MKIDPASGQPIFLQVAEGIEDAILTGAFAEGERVPSTTEFATTWGINPATALKGLNILESAGILEKRRGLGTYVKQGARQALFAKRQASFEADYLQPLLQEARNMGIKQDELIAWIRNANWEEET